MKAELNIADQNSPEYLETINGIIKEHPSLIGEGLGLSEAGRNSKLYTKDEIFKLSRARLFGANAECAFNECCKYLRLVKCTKTFRPHAPSSYHLKHCVEKWTPTKAYVPNGIFIAAAIHIAKEIGLKAKIRKGSNNLVYNIKPVNHLA